MNATAKAWARPQSLVEVADASASLEDFHPQLRYYPPARISPRAAFLVREILGALPSIPPTR